MTQSPKDFETDKQVEIEMEGFARMTVEDDGHMDLPLESGILNMHGWKQKALDETAKDYRIYAQPTVDDFEKIGCQECGEYGNWYKHGKRTMRIVDLPVHGKQSTIIVGRQRWRCKNCKSTVQETLPYVHASRNMTERVLSYIELQALAHTFAHVARDVGVSESTVSNIFQDFATRLEEHRRMETPRVLGIDEVYIGKKSRAVFTDVEGRIPIDMLPTRKKTEVKKWLSELDTHRVKVVIMDMWKPYKDAVKEVIPDAVIVVDKFHVVRMANDALNKVRRSMKQTLPASQRRQLKRDRYILLRRRSDLDEQDEFLLQTWIENFEQLGYAYASKEMFCDIWESETVAEAKRKYAHWLEWMEDKGLKKWFADLVRAMRNWHDEIFAHFEHRYTNAYTEAMNGILKIINRNGRGYSFKALRAKVIYANFKKDTYLDMSNDYFAQDEQNDFEAAWYAFYGEEWDDGESDSPYKQLPLNWR